RVTEERKDFARAVVIDVLEASPDRLAPPCPALAEGCGGCTWQHVSPDAQVRFKADIVVDALRRIGRLTDPPRPSVVPLPGPALRTTARLAVTAADGRAGHRRRGGDSAAEGLVAAVTEAVGDGLPAGGGGHLVDAYAGVGLFGSVLGAARGARVTAIDNDKTAAADARVNLADIAGAKVVVSEVGRWRPG